MAPRLPLCRAYDGDVHSAWMGPDGEVAVAGSFGDIAVHHHPAVQVAVGVDGPLELVTGDGDTVACRIAAIASGVRHALRCGPGVTPVSVYLRPEIQPGTAVNALARAGGGIWVSDDSTLCDSTATVLRYSGLASATRHVIAALPTVDVDNAHPQLRRAVDVVRADHADAGDLSAVARAVALSPDYLGRLFARQNGVSFSTTTRWLRLLAGLGHITQGESVTDAAHAAGFTDGAHANRACWELMGAAPSGLARALAKQDGSVQAHRGAPQAR